MDRRSNIALVDIVINAAPSFVPDQARNLIDALGERKRVSGGDVWFMQVSLAAFSGSEKGTNASLVIRDDRLLKGRWLAVWRCEGFRR